MSLYSTLPKGFIPVALYGALVSYVAPNWFGLLSLFLMMYNVGWARPQKQSVRGSVFVTGCDLGLGKACAIYLANIGYHVFAGCLTKTALKSIEDESKNKDMKGKLEYIQIDVSDKESVSKAGTQVRKSLKAQLEADKSSPGLIGLVHCAGATMLGPAQFLKEEFYLRSLKINFLGAVNLTQELFPFFEDSTSEGKARARIVFVGGEGPSHWYPCPALGSAYGAASNALEAYCQSLRMEMDLKHVLIESTMVYPGLVKQTGYLGHAEKISEQVMAKLPSLAETRYKKMMTRFFRAASLEKGNTEIKFAQMIAYIIRSGGRVKSSYTLGASLLAPLQGILPDGIKEYIWKASRFSPKYSNNQ